MARVLTPAARRTVLAAALAPVLLPPAAMAAVVWDGGPDASPAPDASGNWDFNTLYTNFTGDVLPTAADDVTLGDVTAGTRAVAYDASVVAAGATVLSLNLTQATAGAVNQLNVLKTLGIAATAGSLTTTTGAAGGTVVNLGNGVSSGTLSFTGAGTVVQNAGTINFTAAGTAVGRVSFTQNAGSKAFNNTGVITFTGGTSTNPNRVTNTSTTTGGSTGGTYALNNGFTGTAAGATGQITFSAGSHTFLGVDSAAVRGNTVTVRNYAGQIDVAAANAGTTTIELKGSETFTSAGASRTLQVQNDSGATFNVGTAGQATGTGYIKYVIPGNPTANFTFNLNNAGTFNLHGTSRIDGDRTGIGYDRRQLITNAATGTFNAYDNARLGTANVVTIFNNAGTFNKLNAGTVTIFSSGDAASSDFGVSGANLPSTANSGTINVQAGQLTFATALGTLNNTGTITGGGTLGAAAIASTGGTFNPGNAGSGRLSITATNVAADANTVFNFELAAPDAADSATAAAAVGANVDDLLSVSGTFALNGTLNITGLSGFGDGTYNLFEHAGALTDNGLVLGTRPYPDATYTFVGTNPGGPGVYQLVVSGVVVPEPSAGAVALVPALGLAARRSRRTR